MPKIPVNLDDVKDVVDPGWYLCKVTGEEIRTSEGSGYDYINWELEIDEPESEFHGQKLWYITSLKPTALSMLKNFLEACGFVWNSDGFHSEDVLGYTLEVQVAHEEYEGRMQNRIKNVRAV